MGIAVLIQSLEEYVNMIDLLVFKGVDVESLLVPPQCIQEWKGGPFYCCNTSPMSVPHIINQDQSIDTL